MPNRLRRAAAVLAAALTPTLLVAGCGRGPLTTASEPGPGAGTGTVSTPHSADPYDDPARWICRPDRTDVCSGDLDATVVAADGSTTPETWTKAADPPVDCFYVYPTTSRDPGANSDWNVGEEEEVLAVRAQVARYGSTCRVFAPVYRQLTVSGVQSLFAQGGPEALAPDATGVPGPAATAYGDVLTAFVNYLAGSKGRGFILIGHSQGSSLLAQLLNTAILPNPEMHRRLVAAYLVGLPVGVRPDPSVPACRSDHQTGCVLAYSSYRSTQPPGSDTVFGHLRPGVADDPAGCTNPAALVGTAPALHPYFVTAGRSWVAPPAPAIGTPFVTTPGLVTGECRVRDNISWLEITVHGDPSDPRADDIPGDLIPGWGLHWADMQLTQGDLIELARRQGAAWRAAN